MKYSFYILICFVCFGCTSKVTNEDLKHLNGYWEIEKVAFPDGETKTYTVNPNIDYIEWDGTKGFRKKMQPKFDGSYTTSNDAEPFTIIQTKGAFEFYYKNEMSEWKEQILSVSKEQFSVINQDTLTYTYKRFHPIEIHK